MALFDFAAPARWVTSQRGYSVCAVCHAWPAAPICSPCVERFAQPLARCPQCALPGHTTPCPACTQHPPPWERSLCAVPYGYPWDTCLARLKFEGNSAMGRALAHVMQHAPGIEPALEEAQWVVPMPLSSARLRERGFNQSLVLARHLGPRKTLGQALLRIRDTAPQASLPKAQRLQNVVGTMVVHPRHAKELKGCHVVLLDDVMTTGSSLHAAALALRQVGVQHITAMVFARTDSPRVEVPVAP
jgi:ComF family protein